MKPRISIMTIGVDDLERAVTFYRDGPGCPTVVFFDLLNGQKLARWSWKDATEFSLGQ